MIKMLSTENDVETVVLLSDKMVDGYIDIDLDVEKLERPEQRLCIFLHAHLKKRLLFIKRWELNWQIVR